ncbi:MAG TPA: prenyltransferase/squalene oxidase repeat-containing protein [Phycisphaerae bacterium]|nr:prenyltransferase/squalene oxidase repeat-containing protein [Phycisphaerae bacterium]
MGLPVYGILHVARVSGRSRQLLTFSLAAVIALVGSASSAEGGPNLVANGDLNHTDQNATARMGFGERAVYYTFDGDAHFGRVVAVASGSAWILRDNYRVAYRELSKVGTGGQRGLLLDPGEIRDAGDLDVSVWFDLKGKIQPDTEYEYTVLAVVSSDRNEPASGFKLMVPALWADGKPMGAEVDVSLTNLLENVTGTIRTPAFRQQTGPTSMVLKLPRNFNDRLLILRMSLREVDRSLVEGKTPPMPVPVRYVPIEDPLEFRIVEALQNSAEYLRGLRGGGEGGWQVGDQEESVRVTSMVVSALAEMGDRTDEGPLAEAMDWLAEQLPEELEDEADADNIVRRLERDLRFTETHAWRLYCLCRWGDPAGNPKHRQVVAHDIVWLEGAQFDDGGWGRIHSELEEARAMHSENDSAALAATALREALLVGRPCDHAVALNAVKYWLDAQTADGGYRSKLDRYGGVSEATTVTRTAAGVASLLATMDMAFAAGGTSCDQFRRNRPQMEAIRKGLDWVDTRYLGEHKRILDVLRKTFGQGQITDMALENLVGGGFQPFQTAFYLQRLAEISGRARFSGVDSFQKEAERLLDWFYQRDARQFQGGAGPTAWALVTLAGGHAPLALQRILVSDNRDDELLRDADHLSRYLSATFGRSLKWRDTTIGRPIDELLQVPILLLNVAGPINWTQPQWDKIRDYCFAGGLVLINVGEENKPGRDAIESGLRTTFPEYELAPLAADDPVLTIRKRVSLEAMPTVVGNGLKNFVFLLPQDYTCAWHTFDYRRQPEVYDLVANLLEYTTDGEPLLATFAEANWEHAAEGTRTVPVARMECGADRPAFPDFIETLDRTMRANYRTGLKEGAAGGDAPILLWVANAGTGSLTSEQSQRIRQALADGTYVLAEVIGGDPDRAETFHAELQQLDPKLAVRKLRTSHPVFTGMIEGTQGYDVRRTRLSRSLREEVADQGRCDLYALELDGREVGVLSEYDLSSAVSFMRYSGRRGPASRAGRELAVNAVLHAMQQSIREANPE